MAERWKAKIQTVRRMKAKLLIGRKVEREKSDLSKVQQAEVPTGEKNRKQEVRHVCRGKARSQTGLKVESEKSDWRKDGKQEVRLA